MKEFLLTMATAMKKENIVEQLKEQAQEFILTNGKNDRQLSFMCMLYLINESTDGKTEQARDLLKKWNEHEKITDLFNIQKN